MKKRLIAVLVGMMLFLVGCNNTEINWTLGTPTKFPTPEFICGWVVDKYIRPVQGIEGELVEMQFIIYLLIENNPRQEKVYKAFNVPSETYQNQGGLEYPPKYPYSAVCIPSNSEEVPLIPR
jgi:hypothetical protein